MQFGDIFCGTVIIVNNKLQKLFPVKLTALENFGLYSIHYKIFLI